MSKSVIIIGGGLGGLFTGAILAKEGLQVTVIEKNAIIGGGLQSFKRFGELFDTGMHIIGGMQKDGSIRRICEYLGIWDKVRVKDTDPDHSDCVFFAEDGRTYQIAKGRTHFIDTLAKDFPDQKENLAAYVDALYWITDEVDLFYLRPSSDYMQVHSEDFRMSADAFIANYITDAHLRAVLAYLNPLYGGREGVTPAYVHALISVLYIDGASRFAGGSLSFAETLRDSIVACGGSVLSGDGVRAVHNEGRSISGVTTESGKQFSADYYVCAIHPCTFFPLLDDESILPKPYRSRLNSLPNSYSAFTLNIKLKPRTFRFFNYTQYYMARYDVLWKIGEPAQWPCGFLCITPPEVEQEEYASKMIVTAPMTWDACSKWADTTPGHRCAEYEAWKAEQTEKLLRCMEEVFPGFWDCIEDINSASPLTIRDFYGVKEGSMYGFSKDCNNPLLTQVPVVTKVPNLFLTGQNCNLHGFCGVALTAVNTSEAILGRNYILNKLNRFNDIRPYYDCEVNQAMRRVARNPLTEKVVRFLNPEADMESVRNRLEHIVSAAEFQAQFMYPAVGKIVEKTSRGYTCDGLERLSKDKNYLFVSNHRDIVLDAALVTYATLSAGWDSPEITFGANLMQGELIVDIGKSNKMFRVERPGTDVREFYRQSEHLSDYIRTTLLQKKQSVWIAQRNGRTKDGMDRTDQAIVKMFAMSGPRDRVQAIADLNIVPVSISYEWEPCDLLKAVETYRRSQGPYKKKEGEDLNSILTGLLQEKGRIHFTLCEPLTEEDLRPFAGLPSNAFFKKVASLIDARICPAYRLFPNNHIAHDLLSGMQEFAGEYSPEQKQAFESHLSSCLAQVAEADRDAIRERLLGIYAAPVDSKKL